MPNRPEDHVNDGAGPIPQAAEPTDDLTFEAHDARLEKELRRFDKARAGSRGAEFPHDESYTPGIHEGGARFGFFNGKDSGASPANPATDPAPPKADDKA